jgi:hypothetical protein
MDMSIFLTGITLFILANSVLLWIGSPKSKPLRNEVAMKLAVWMALGNVLGIIFIVIGGITLLIQGMVLVIQNLTPLSFFH